MTTLKVKVLVLWMVLWYYCSNIYCIYIFPFYFTVYDSDNSLIVKACGKIPPPLVVSSSNTLTINFKTDGSRNATGFKAVWTTETVYNITSPDYPQPYPEDNDEVNFSFLT